MNVTELCRKNLYGRLGVDTTPKRDVVSMQREILKTVSTLEKILKLAKPRLILGGIRYGSDWTHEDLMDYIQKKFDNYRETGNFEMLVDCINLMSVEGANKTHPNFHFEAEDRRD